MSDWKDRALPVAATDWKNRAVSLPTSAPEEPGSLEALARGAEQGATFGFGDEINGALSTAGDVLTGQNKDLDLLEDYRKQRDESRANMAAAEEAHPLISGAGNIIGALAPALLSGGTSAAAEGAAAGGAAAGEGILGAVQSGAKVGALAGLGNSTADLTKGDVGQAVSDVGHGAAGGAITGVALKGLVNGVQKAGGLISDLKTPSNLKEAFNQGLQQNRKLVGTAANASLQQNLLNSYNGLDTSLQNSANLASAAKTQKLLNADQSVNMFPWLKGFNNATSNISENESADPAVASELDRVKNYVSRYLTGASDEEGNQILNGKLDEQGGLSPADLDRMRAKLASWSASGDESLKTPEIRALVTRLVSPLERDPSLLENSLGLPEGFQAISGESGMLNQSVPGLNDLNQQISGSLKAQDALPSLNQVLNSPKNNQSGVTALGALQDFLKVAPKDVIGDQIDNLQSLAKGKDIANIISTDTFGKNGFIKRGALAGSNLIGLTIRKLYDATPETLKQLGSKIAQTDTTLAGQKLSTMLSNAADKDNIGRNALFFAIQQNPEYRRILANSTQSDESQ